MSTVKSYKRPEKPGTTTYLLRAVPTATLRRAKRFAKANSMTLRQLLIRRIETAGEFGKPGPKAERL